MCPAQERDIKGCYRIQPDGTPIPLRVQSNAPVGLWMPCFDHPGTRQECGRFIEAYVKRYQDHSALLMWDVWVEPRSRPVWECACEYSATHFRNWLRNRFGDLDQLNRTLHQRFGDWEDIMPPTDALDYTQMYLWRQWAMWSLEDRVRWAADLHRQHDATGKPVMVHVGASSVVQDAVDDSSDDWLNSRCVDFFGSSLPYFGATFTNPNAKHQYFYIGLLCDEIRSLSPYYWIMEIYPDPLNWQQGHLSPEDVRFYDWTCVAHGAKGLVYWQYRPERFGRESLGMGLVDNEGNDTPRSLESKAIRRVVMDNEQVFIQGHRDGWVYYRTPTVQPRC